MSIATGPALRIPGFADPTHDAQRVFRAVLDALARPTLAQQVVIDIRPPQPLGPVVGAVILTLCDEQTPVWVDAALRAEGDVTAWIGFHTGARIVDDPGEALFIVVSSPEAIPALADLRAGTDEEPHLSATVIVDAREAEPQSDLIATGPGVNGQAHWDGRGLPADFIARWRQNSAQFPRGVDLILAEADAVRGLPRTTVLATTDREELG